MLPSGNTTLLCEYLADHPEEAFTCGQYAVYVSSPKYHAQPVGLFDDASVKKTGRGAGPEVKLALKLATGANSAAAVVPGINTSRSSDTMLNEISNDLYLIILSPIFGEYI
jgi:hypothetical protein